MHQGTGGVTAPTGTNVLNRAATAAAGGAGGAGGAAGMFGPGGGVTGDSIWIEAFLGGSGYCAFIGSQCALPGQNGRLGNAGQAGSSGAAGLVARVWSNGTVVTP